MHGQHLAVNRGLPGCFCHGFSPCPWEGLWSSILRCSAFFNGDHRSRGFVVFKRLLCCCRRPAHRLSPVAPPLSGGVSADQVVEAVGDPAVRSLLSLQKAFAAERGNRRFDSNGICPQLVAQGRQGGFGRCGVQECFDQFTFDLHLRAQAS